MNDPVAILQLAEAIEARTRLLRELASELEASRDAYVAMDTDAIYRHVTAQMAICERLRDIERKYTANAEGGHRGAPLKCLPEKGSVTAAGDPALAERFRGVLADMALAEQQARQLHRAHTVMLEGTRRTIRMMANALITYSPVYPQPAHAGSTPGSRI
jgi:hypothetical protein